MEIKSLILCIIYFFISSSFQQNIYNDEKIINYIIKQKIKSANKLILLNSSNDNKSVISIIEEIEFINKTNNSILVDSVYNSYGIKNKKDFISIFNIEEFNYLKSQKQNEKWNLKNTNLKNIVLSEDKKESLIITKPIYTKNQKFALVYVMNKKSSYIMILKKEKDKWKEYKYFLFAIN